MSRALITEMPEEQAEKIIKKKLINEMLKIMKEQKREESDSDDSRKSTE